MCKSVHSNPEPNLKSHLLNFSNRYYAHTHPCGHTKTVFAAYCPSAALMQKPCGRGEIWATVKMEAACSQCYEEPESIVSKTRKSVTRKVSRR